MSGSQLATIEQIVIKPKLRPIVFDALLKDYPDLRPLVEHLAWLVNIPHQTYPELDSSLQQSCCNCIYFVRSICSLYKRRPPDKVIAYGCKDHSDCGEIPF